MLPLCLQCVGRERDAGVQLPGRRGDLDSDRVMLDGSGDSSSCVLGFELNRK